MQVGRLAWSETSTYWLVTMTGPVLHQRHHSDPLANETFGQSDLAGVVVP
ncbi:hypothetical protein IWX81_002209 [Salinibacterium sp. CAN_S4]